MAARLMTEEEAARNRQNVLIAESCQSLKETTSLNPYRDYRDAAMKLLGYHILADVDQEAADVSETCDGAGHKLLMSARHVWDEHLQRRADSCITTLATLHDNLSSRTRAPAQSRADAAPGAAKASRAYEDLKVEEWMREARLDWESGVRTEVSKLDEEIVQVRYKRQCVEHDMAMHKEAEEAKAKGLPPPAPRPYAPPPAASQAPSIPPNPVAPPPVAPQPAAAPVAHYAQQQPHAAAPQHRAPMYAAPRPGTLRPGTYGGRTAAAQPLRPAYSTAPTQAGQPRASAGSYAHVRPAAPQAVAPGGPPVVMSQSAAAAYASWQAAAAGMPQSVAAAPVTTAPATVAQPAQPAQPAAYNMAFANRPPPTIPTQEAHRRAQVLFDAHRAQQAQTSMTAGRGLQGARGGARRPNAPQMAARPAMRPAGAPGRATELSQAGEPVKRGVGRPPGPGRGRGRGRGPGRPSKPTTVDFSQ